MSDLTNTPKVRTPAYAASAERFNAERELGRRVAQILRDRAKLYVEQAGPPIDPSLTGEFMVRAVGDRIAFFTVFECETATQVRAAARALGLLPEARP